jgi:hypothetical protein
MNQIVAWGIIFIGDEGNFERMVERMVVIKGDRGRAEKYAGDPLKPHDEPKRIRPMVFADEESGDER